MWPFVFTLQQKRISMAVGRYLSFSPFNNFEARVLRPGFFLKLNGLINVGLCLWLMRWKDRLRSGRMFWLSSFQGSKCSPPLATIGVETISLKAAGAPIALEPFPDLPTSYRARKNISSLPLVTMPRVGVDLLKERLPVDRAQPFKLLRVSASEQQKHVQVQSNSQRRPRFTPLWSTL